jgi:hypothetical protein
MRQFAIIKDVSSDKLFAIIVKDDDFTVCHGVHAAGKKWAESYNKGLTKSIYDDLQPGISVGSFAPVRATTQALIDEATEGKPVRFPDHSQLVYVKSVNYRYAGEIPQVKDAGLSNLTDKDFFIGADYKGSAFRADSARLSLLAKARLGHFGADSKGFNFTEKGTDQKALNEELFQTARGSGNARRAAKAVLLEKHLNLEEHPGYLGTKEHSSSIRTKANRLGRRLAPGGGGGRGRGGIRKIGRSMKDPFDPNAWDGDNDGIVQEGTVWERPSIPGVNTNLPGQRHTRTKPRSFPRDDADGVEFRLRNRREENRAQDEILSTPVGEVIEDFPEATEALRNTLSGFSEDDDIWETPLRDITDDGEYFGEDDLDRLLDIAVPRRREGTTDSFYRDEQGMRSQRLQPGDKVTVRHRGEDTEGTIVRLGQGGASGVGTDSYVVDVGERQSLWKRSDEILGSPGGMPSQRGMRSERYDITRDEAGKWRVIDTGNRNMRLPEEYDNREEALREAIRRDNPRGGMRSQRRPYAGTIPDRSGETRQERENRRMRGEFDEMTRVGRAARETHEEPDGSIYEFRPTLHDKPERGGNWIDITDPGQRSEMARRATERRQHEAQTGTSMGRLARPGAGSEWDRITRGGMRSRARDASVDRASQLQGMRSSRRRRRGQAEPGLDRHSDIDGQIWENLTDAERAHVGTAIDTEMRRRMHGLAWNDMNGIDPRKPKQKKRSEMTPEEEMEATFHVNPLGGIVKQYFDQAIRPDFEKDYEGDELAQKLRDYIFTDADIDTIEAAIESQIEATGDATDKAADQLKDQLREIRIYRNMVEQSNNGKDPDAFRFLEHLTPTQRARIYNRANGADKDRLETSKASWGLSKGNRINSTIGSTFTERQAAIDAVEPGVRRRAGEFSRSMAQRIWAPNPNNAYRRALRKARRGGAGSSLPGFRREEDKRSIVARRVAQLRRKLRVVKGRKGIQGAINASEKKQIKKAVDFDADGKLVTSDEGIARLGKASRALLGDKSVLKDVRMKGRGGKGTDGASEDEVEKILNQNPEMAVIWDAMGMNDLPVVVDDDNFEALIDAGHPVIGRGHGSASNATDYLDDELRFLPGGGGEASGKGEYWSTGQGSWGSWQTVEGGNTVAVLTPNVRRMDGDTLDAEFTANRSVSRAFELVRATYPGDELEKADIAEVVSRMDAEIAKITDLAEGAPIWETEVGQLWTHLLDSIRTSGNPDSLNAMLLLNKINNTSNGRNLIAPILGYDTIQSGSVELVMNRSAVITLGRTLGSSGLSQFFKQASDVRSEGRRARA